MLFIFLLLLHANVETKDSKTKLKDKKDILYVLDC